MTKPFGRAELMARHGAVLRRAKPEAAEPLIEADGLRIDLAARAVHRDEEPVHRPRRSSSCFEHLRRTGVA